MTEDHAPGGSAGGTPPDGLLALRCSEAGDHVHELICDAERSIVAFGPRLDLPELNMARTAEALTRFVVAHPRNQLRLLIEDERWFMRHNPRLVTLCRQFSTFAKVKRLPEDFWPTHTDLYIVVDSRSYFHVPKIEETHCVIVRDDRPAARRLSNRFDQDWQVAESLSELFSLGL